jgi:hypothetical protein
MNPNVNLVTGAVALLTETAPPWIDVGCRAFRILADARHERDALALADRLAPFVTDPDQYATLQAAAACRRLYPLLPEASERPSPHAGFSGPFLPRCVGSFYVKPWRAYYAAPCRSTTIGT